jgi:hypothetical protein
MHFDQLFTYLLQTTTVSSLFSSLLIETDYLENYRHVKNAENYYINGGTH